MHLTMDITLVTNLCEAALNPISNEGRLNAEKLLDYSYPTFSDGNPAQRRLSGDLPPGLETNARTPVESAFALVALLENSRSPYAHMFACTRLAKIVQDHFVVFPLQQKIYLRNFILRYAGSYPNLIPFVLNKLAEVFAIVTKVGWFDDDQFKNVHEDMGVFLQASVEHKIIGLLILGVVVEEINKPNAPKNLTRYRKTSVSFRDSQLLEIFQTGFKMLEALLNRRIPFTQPNQESLLKENTLKLLKCCLSFDFIGTTPDESGDDIGSIQVPSPWKVVFADGTFLPTMFECYKEFAPGRSSQVMECLVQVASVRRSLFTEEERGKFVMQMMQGIQDILVSSRGLTEENNYHEFCRMLSRFRSTYQLGELAEKSNYNEWVELVGSFSVEGFHAWQSSQNSVQYLLSFWSKMVSSMSHAKPASTGKLEAITVELTRAYTQARIDSVEPTIREELDDALNNEDALSENLELLAIIARCKYDESSAAVAALFDPVAQHYANMMQQASSSNIVNNRVKEALVILEIKLAWLVHIIGVLIGGRTAYLSSEDLDNIDGELTAKIIELMQMNQFWVQQRGEEFGCEKLESAFLFFFQQFRKAYIGENSMKVIAVYQKLEAFGITDQQEFLAAIVMKLATNLKLWPHNQNLISKTLRLFNDIASGYTSVKQLRKVDTTKYLMNNHSSENFPFLDESVNLTNRMAYYSALSKILFSEDSGKREFDNFVKPLEITLQYLGSLNSIADFRQEPVKRTLLGLFKDLRGIITPINSRNNFALFFDWFYPEHCPIVIRALAAWGDDPLAVVILKFVLEFIHNKSQRLNFDISSVNGILLFRETSQVLVTYGQYVLNRPDTAVSDKYKERYKGIAACFNILGRSLGGRYINFGVFGLYNDKALALALDTFFKMVMSIPMEDLMAFPKLSRAYFGVVDIFSNEHMMAMQRMDSNTFLYMMRACAEGIKSTDTGICSQACSTVDHIGTFVIQQSEKEKSRPHWLVEYLNQYSDVLPYLFTILFNVILFEDRSIQWSLSRPLLVLILLNQDYFFEYSRSVIYAQLPERQEFLEKALTDLMDKVDMSVATKNRDTFTNNLSTFRRDLNAQNMVLIPPSHSENSMAF